jgi:hypothetical protein
MNQPSFVIVGDIMLRRNLRVNGMEKIFSALTNAGKMKARRAALSATWPREEARGRLYALPGGAEEVATAVQIVLKIEGVEYRTN